MPASLDPEPPETEEAEEGEPKETGTKDAVELKEDVFVVEATSKSISHGKIKTYSTAGIDCRPVNPNRSPESLEAGGSQPKST